MGETPDQIVSEIDRTREQLKSNLRELEERARAATDWRTQFERHPGRMMAAAVVGGMLLSSLLRRH